MDKHEQVADDLLGAILAEEIDLSTTEAIEQIAVILRREYGGEEKPGHIYAGLDFIPVVERLPEEAENVWAIVDGRLDELYMCNNMWLTASEGEFVSTDEGKRVTHWVEIPVIKG